MTAFRPVKYRPHRPPNEKARQYKQLWKLVDGAVRDTMLTHPDYFPNRKRLALIRASVSKRIVGALIGFVEQSTEGEWDSLKREHFLSKMDAPTLPVLADVASPCGDKGRGERHAPAQTAEAA